LGGCFEGDLAAAIDQASLVVLCTPIGGMESLARQMMEIGLSADALVTDVGSVKGPVVAALQVVLGGRFVGSHPMAGSERTGMAAAREDLFDKAACIVTPTAVNDQGDVRRIDAFWKLLGGRVHHLEPLVHDDQVARISHLPHLMAVLTTLAALEGDEEALRFSAGGFRDTTRVAAGDPAMWRGILEGNRDAVLRRLEALSALLQQVRGALRDSQGDGLESLLSRAQELRRRLPSP
jgi:prephenate dehydrogenase